MIGIVLVTHEHLGKALIDAAQFVLGGSLPAVTAVSVDLNQSAVKLREDIKKAIKSVSENQGVLVLTDMFGGTPSNLGYSFLEEGVIEVLSGVNLPILLRACNKRQNMDLKALAQEVEAYGKKSICLASGILKGNKKTG